MRSSHRLLALAVSAALAACGGQPAPHEHEAAADKPPFLPPELAGRGGRVYSFTNGGFESGNLSGWTTATYLNPGLAVSSPTTRADLRLAAGGAVKTSVKTAPQETLLAAGVAAAATLKIPKYGTNAVVVNELGNNRNVNGIKQSMVITNADVDPNDNKAHVRFALAPVLENPSHSATQQPYFWITLTNVTRGNAVLFYTFNYANQPGVPWKSTTDPADGEAVLYTDWQAFDISPGAAQLAVGDTVELEIIAGGCSLGGHYGHVYLDGIGAYLPGLGVAASAPASVNTGTTLTYTYRYSNNGIDAAPSTVVTAVLPTGTTFASLSAPGASCTTPAVGAAGTVTCNVGTVNPASNGAFTVTVNVTAASGATVSHGNYTIQAASVSPIIGPLVTTAVTAGTTYVDLATTASDGVAAVGWGATTVYAVTVRNNGPSAAAGAAVAVPVPANVSAFTGWTCTASGGATCGAASGAGAVSTTASLPSGGQVTYAITAAVAAGTGSSSISLQATATAPGGTTDNTPSNNVAVDYDQVGTLRTLLVQKSGAGAGTVLSSPAAISCGAACTSQSAVFLDGTAVALTASTAAGNRFMSWTAGPCAGSTSPTCGVPLGSDVTVTADFMAGDWLVSGSAPAGNGSVSCQSPRLNGQPSTCTLTPAPRHRLTALTDNGSNVLGAVAGGAYAVASVTADHAVVGTFSANTSSTALAATPASPATFGQAVTLTATVSAVAPAGTPTGTVDFADGATPLCTGVALSGGVATCTTSALATGAHAVTATYAADATWAGSTSPGLAYTVDQAATTLALAAAPSPSTFGAPVTLTATLAVTAPGGGAPGGTVTFTDGASVLCAAVPVSGGSAACTTSALSAGAHTLGASYSGAAGYLAATAPTTSLTVDQATTAVTLTTTGSPSTYGAPVTLTATLSGPGTPGGTFTFRDGAAVLCAPVAVVAGVATCTTSALAAGSHALSATYSGDADHLASTGGAAQVVAQATPTIALAASPDPSVTGQSVAITVTVTGPGAPPTGTVTVTDGVAVLCGGPIALVAGVGTCGTGALPPGAHLLVAAYSGDANHAAGAGATQDQTVERAATSVALAVAPAAGVYGQPVVLTATVTVPAPGAGSPGGTVQFFDGATLLGTAAVDPITGVATLTIPAGSPLAVGSHAFTVAYGGDAAFQGSLSPAVPTFPVGQASTLVTVTPAPASPVFGQAVAFAIDVSAVAPGSGTPTGAVTVTVDGGAPAALALSGGRATFATSALSAGSHLVEVSYGGDASFLGATGAVTQPVARAAATVTLSASPAPSTFGGAITLTAAVAAAPPGAGTPGGTVTFTDGGAVLCGGPVAVVAGQATCTTTALPVGTRALAVDYGGDAGFSPAPGAASLAQVVEKATAAVTLGGLSQVYTGSPLAATATTTPAGLTVTFTYDGSSTAPTGAGTYAVVATVQDPSYQGSASGTFTITKATATVTLSDLTQPYTGAPRAATATTSPAGLAVTLTYDGSPTAPAGVGSYAVVATVQDANHQGSATGTLSITRAAPTVTLASSVNPSVYLQQVVLTATVGGVGPTPTGTVTFSDGAAPLCGAPVVLGGGKATCTVNAFGVATHALTATYSGDATYLDATGALAQVVQPAATATALGASTFAPVYGQAMTLTATVSTTSPGGGIPAGAVAFQEGGTTWCAAAPITGSTATCTLPAALATGPHTFTASYLGSSQHAASDSPALARTVARAEPTVAMASSGSPSAYGAPVTFTATVSGPAGAPTGAVTFSAGGVPLCAAVPLDAGVARCTSAALAPGSRIVTGDYGGDPNHTAASAFVTQLVNTAAPTVTASASPDPSTYGQAVTLAATVTGAGAVPTGTVAFAEGGTTLCTTTLDAAGAGACTSVTLPVGLHAVSAQYQGDARYDPATGATSVTVDRAAASVAIASSANPSTYAATVAFTATVGGPGATPTGAVTFRDGGAVLCGGPVALAAGRATCTLSGAAGLAGGTHAVTASYGGSTSHLPGDSAPLAQVVNPATSTLALATSGTPSVYGAPVTFTATLGGAGVTPGGSVTFTDNGAPLCGPVAVAGGVATCSTGALVRGLHTIGATSTGDANYLGASASRVQVVTEAAPVVALMASPASSVFGEEVVFTVTVGGAGATPTGAVTITEGTSALCGGPLPLVGGTATCRKADFGAGDHLLAASYSGDANYAAGSPAGLRYTVRRAPTAIALEATPAGAVYGQPVTLTATVTVPPPGAGLPTGPVDFYDGAALVGTADVDPVTGVATLVVPADHLLAAGSHDLTAAYGGDADFEGSLSDAVAGFTIGQATPLVAVTAAPSPSVFGGPVTITVDVAAEAPGGGTAGGTVLLSLDGGAPVELTLSGGRAALTTSTLEVGDHAVAVTYPGDPNFQPGSGGAALTVGRAATALTASASPTPSVFGQPVTFTAAVAAVAPGAGLPTGTVRLVVDGAPVASGPLDAAGLARLSVATLPVGAHALSVEYLGDGRFQGSLGALDHQVMKAFTEVTLAASEALTVYGAPVTLSAAVTPAFFGAGAPTGAVTFREGAAVLAVVQLDPAARAAFTTAELAPGTHLIEADYAGDASFQDGTSLPVPVGVQPAVVTVSLAVGPNPSVTGETVTWSVRAQAAAPSLAVPQGTVEIIETAAGETVLQALTLDAAGTATGGSAGLPPGLHRLSARLVADGRFLAQNEPAVVQQVARAATSVALSASPSPSTFGATVSFTARVSVQDPGGGTPGGAVAFSVDGQPAGSAPLDALGEATFQAADLHAGPHQVVATYAGDAGYLPAASIPFTQVVMPAGTAASATAAPAASVYGQPVTLSATVTSSAGVPAGLVDFLADGVSLGKAALDAGGGATLTTAALAVGSHAVVANYLGDPDHQPVAAPAVTAVVGPAATTTALSATPLAAVAGQPITLVAEVLPVAPGAGRPTGQVTFRDGGASLGSAPVDAATRRATLRLSSLAVGAHAVTADYPGDGSFLGSESGAALALQVDRAAAAVAVGVDPAAPVTGQPVTLTAVVSAAAPGAGTPTGQVTFSDGATPLGTATLSGGRASVTAALPGGSRTVQVAYAGDAAFDAATGGTTVVVGRAGTTTGLVASASPSVFGQPLTLTATVLPVAPGAGVPGGEVTFRDGAATLGTVAVGAGGVAALSPALAVGAHALTAEYGGDAGFAPSGAALQQEVRAAPVAVQVAASPSPAEYGEPVAVTVTVAPQGGGAGTPAGAVTLLDGATPVGTAALGSGGATFALQRPTVGIHQLTATYPGGGGFAAGSTSVELEVRAAPVTLTVRASRNPIRAGQTVRLTATASADHATPTGTVAFKDGPLVIGTAALADGVATFSTRALRKGSHAITAQLPANGGFAAGAGALPEPLVVENSPPVAGGGTALALGPGHALRAVAPAVAALETASGTVELWARAGWSTPAEAGSSPSLVRLGGPGGDRWAIGVTPDRAGITVTLGDATTTIPAPLGGGWHHLALAAGADAATVYLDGAEIGAVDGRFGAAAGAALTVGEGFVGEVDELRLWSSTRDAAALAATARRPLTGQEPALIGLWRMDEGRDADLFDAGPAGADLVAAPDAGAPGATAFVPSEAWRRRTALPDRPMAPIAAGYDADGDPLALEPVTAPAHGTASFDAAALQIGYRPATGYLGEDLLAWRLTDDEGASSQYEVAVSVEQPLICTADADCAAGTVCAQGACVDPGDQLARSGGCGCTSGGGGALALWSLLALGLTVRRRPRRDPRAEGGRP